MNQPEALNGPTPILDHRLNEPTQSAPPWWWAIRQVVAA